MTGDFKFFLDPQNPRFGEFNNLFLLLLPIDTLGPTIVVQELMLCSWL
jgi:hypothetical protein